MGDSRKQVFHTDSTGLVETLFSRLSVQVMRLSSIMDCLESLRTSACHPLLSNPQSPSNERLRLLAESQQTSPPSPAILLVDRWRYPHHRPRDESRRHGLSGETTSDGSSGLRHFCIAPRFDGERPVVPSRKASTRRHSTGSNQSTNSLDVASIIENERASLQPHYAEIQCRRHD